MKRILFFAVLFVLISQAAFAYGIYPLWFHVHSNKSLRNGCSDGQYDIKELIHIALMKKGYSGIIITDHANEILEKESCVKNYFDFVNQYSQEGRFISIAGQEITVAIDPKKPEGENARNCHVNFVSGTNSHQIYSFDYSSDNVGKAVDILREDPNSFLIFNHPRECKLWEDRVSLFDGIELFNDLDAELDIMENYRYQRWVYLQALHQGWHIAAIGGADFHYPPQWELGWVATYVFADKLSREAILDALRDARTIATRNAKVLNFSPVPSRKYYDVEGEIKITGAVSLPIETPIEVLNAKKLLIYRDGEFYQDIRIKGKTYGWGRDKFDFSFTDPAFAEEGEKHCYVLEIERFIVTSPICFEQIQIPQEEPIQKDENHFGGSENALKITDAYYDSNGSIEIKTENDLLLKYFRFYEICHNDNLIKSPQGIISACREPSFVIYKKSTSEEITLYAQGSCGNSTGINFNFDENQARKRCTDGLKNSYILEIGDSDYRAIENGAYSQDFVLITNNFLLSGNETFTACNLYSQSNIDRLVFNNQNKIIGCDERQIATLFKKDSQQSIYNLNFDTLAVLGVNYFILIKK